MTRNHASFFFALAKGRVITLLAATFCAAGLSAASAQPMYTIVDSVGFELPKFDPAFTDVTPPITTVVGDLEGQAQFPEPLPIGTWRRSKAENNSRAVVVNNGIYAPGGGTQSVKVTREASPGGDNRWAVPVSGWPNPGFGDLICIDWDMRVGQTTGGPDTYGPFFGVEAYDADGNAPALFASLGVDSSTGEILYQEPVTGYFVAPGPTVPFDAWNSFQMVLDFGVHEFRLYVNGTPVDLNGILPGLGNATFVDDDLVLGGLNEFTDADISTLAAAGDPVSLALGGSAYFDNFKVVNGPCEVPEPTTASLTIFGILAANYARRRRA